MKQGNRELIVKIQCQIEGAPFSRYYRGFQAEVDKLSLAALTDLKEMLNEVEQRMPRPKPLTAQCECCSDRVREGLVSADGLCEDCVEEEAKADDCPECNGGEVYEGELDVICCGRCDGTGSLS
jgi:hypothetical protein